MNAGSILVTSVGTLALVTAFGAQMVRWLRVLQREHYEPGSMSRFLGRWTSPPLPSAKTPQRLQSRRPITLSHLLFVVLIVSVLLRDQVIAVLAAFAYGVFCPVGLAMKGRTGALQWTRRLKTTASVVTLEAAALTVVGLFSSMPWLAPVLVVWAVPMLLDVTTRLLRGHERRDAQKFVDQAVTRLERVHPRVVAITGSYGKTSTKNHLADLLSADGGVVASPRSFNNRAGLSRAINENLADGTRVFIAEMGTYGPGEIRDLCSWCTPEIAVVTALGPVHLERMKSLDVVEHAKFEITERASTVVVNVDDPRLSKWGPHLIESGKRVVGAGSHNERASVRVVPDAESWSLVLEGEVMGTVPALVGVQPTNVACALAVALELGVRREELVGRLARLTPVSNRSQVVTAPSGVVVIDDTFNANPASAEAALALLQSLSITGRRVVVTPGLIELGSLQHGANISLAQKVHARGAELVVVGRTNAVPLAIGAEQQVRRFDTRDEAVTWVRSVLIAGDGVLYLNDLPDHYP